MTREFDIGPIGDMPCPGCGRTVMYAWDDEMNPVCLDPADDGDVIVAEDANRIPWCRAATDGQLAFGEVLYRLHDPVCPALATVADLGERRKRKFPRPFGEVQARAR